MTRKVLCVYKVPGDIQYGSNKVVPEGVGGDPADRVFAKNLAHAVCDDVASSRCGDGFDLFTGAFVVAGEEGQGG